MEADLAASQGSLVQTSDFPNERHLCLQVPQGRCHLVEVGCDCSRSAEEETEGSKGGEKQRDCGSTLQKLFRACGSGIPNQPTVGFS